MLGILIAAAALAVGWLAAGVAQAQQEQYLILAKGNGFSDDFEAAVQAAGGVVDRKMSAIGVAVARSADPDFTAKASAIPELEAVVPDQILEAVDPMAGAAFAPADVPEPSLSADDLSYLQWGLDAIHAPEAWEAATLAGIPGAREAGVRVAVLDSGIDLTHPDLWPNLNFELSCSLVAGVAALIIGANGGSMHPDQVRTILQRSADDLGKPGNDDFYGAGRVNALNALLD